MSSKKITLRTIIKNIRKQKQNKYYLSHDLNFINNSNLKYFNKNILDYNLEKENNLLLNILLKAPINSSFLDIGGFTGDTSIYLAKELKKNNRNDIQIIIFEPSVENCNIIKSNICNLNLNIVIHNYALSNKEQKLYMKKNEGPGTMYDTCFKENNTNNIIINSKTLDSFNLSNVYLMKIDVEGHEPEVLEGSKNTLEQTKILYVEMWNDNHFKERHPLKKDGSHNLRIINNIPLTFYPIQKIEKNILFSKLNDNNELYFS